MRNIIRQSFLLFLLCGSCLIQQSKTEELAPLQTVNTTAYLGRWFQAYASLPIILTFELGGNCVTADYAETDVEGTITVKNTVRPFFSDILSIVVNGYAVQDPSDDGADGNLEVSLTFLDFLFPTVDSAADAEFEEPGNYWIFALGPVVNDQYQWALVGTPNSNDLYVLARNPEEFDSLYAEEALQICEDYGYTSFLNKPRRTNQSFLCNYG